jgi:predicted N-formylglutamate amidohydrolase
VTSTPFRLVVTCEHAGNHTPPAYAHLFSGARAVLATHRGYDAGALELARRLARRFAAPLAFSRVTRLLVDLNRSIGHPALYSEFSRRLSDEQRRVLLARHYAPYREQVESTIREMISDPRSVMHLSVHSFTPVLNGQERRADIGLLYDPGRPLERSLCGKWTAAIRALRPDLIVRRNYPYYGVSDGFTTWLRKRFPKSSYAGIELEVNQKWVGGTGDWRRLQEAVEQSLATLLDG